MRKVNKILAVGGTAALVASLAACGSNSSDNGGTASGGSFTMGTTDTVTAVDPAGSYDLGSSTLQYSIFQTLQTIPAGSTTPLVLSGPLPEAGQLAPLPAPLQVQLIWTGSSSAGAALLRVTLPAVALPVLLSVTM